MTYILVDLDKGGGKRIIHFQKYEKLYYQTLSQNTKIHLQQNAKSSLHKISEYESYINMEELLFRGLLQMKSKIRGFFQNHK